MALFTTINLNEIAILSQIITTGGFLTNQKINKKTRLRKDSKINISMTSELKNRT